MSRVPQSLEAQLRDAVQRALDAGWTVHALAERAEIDNPTLYNWLSGRRGLGLASVEALARLFGMRLTAPRLPRR